MTTAQYNQGIANYRQALEQGRITGMEFHGFCEALRRLRDEFRAD